MAFSCSNVPLEHHRIFLRYMMNRSVVQLLYRSASRQSCNTALRRAVELKLCVLTVMQFIFFLTVADIEAFFCSFVKLKIVKLKIYVASTSSFDL